MSISQQRRIIAVSSMITFALGFLTAVNKGQTWDQSARFFIGIGFAYTVVSVMSDMGSELGAGFAILIMLAAIFKEGLGVLDWLEQRSAGVSKHGSKTAYKLNPKPAPKGPLKLPALDPTFGQPGASHLHN